MEIYLILRRLQRGSRFAQWHCPVLHFIVDFFCAAATAAVISAAAAAAMAYLYATAACLVAMSEDILLTCELRLPGAGNNCRIDRGYRSGGGGFFAVDADK